jgi:signal transduction histidine kinase
MGRGERGWLVVAVTGLALGVAIVVYDTRPGDWVLEDRSRRGLAWIIAITVLVGGIVGFLLARARRVDARGERRIQWLLLTLAAVTSTAALLEGSAVIFDIAGLEPFRAPTVWLLAIATALGTGIAYSPPPHPAVVRPLRWLIELVVLAAVAGLMWFGCATLSRASSPTTLDPGPAAALVASIALVLVSLHGPIHRATQLFVFGRPEPDIGVVDDFAESAETALSPVEVLHLLTRSAVEGVRLRWARTRLVVPEGGGDVAVAAIGVDLDDADATPALIVALRYSGVDLGTLECGPGSDGKLTERDRKALAALGRHAALGVVTARQLAQIRAQAAELAASRARIVQAQEVERRRIERDLHDGAQQQLIALIAKMRLVRTQLVRDAPKATATLAEAQDDARLALDDLRGLARGIHPPVLSDRGLLDAVESLASRHLVSIRIDAAPTMRGMRFDPDVEGAAYFVVSEALANTTKHACASAVIIALRRTDHRLDVEFTDDGVGFDPGAVATNGLDNLRDRVAALGGALEVDSGAGRGTRLHAFIPVGGEEVGG